MNVQARTKVELLRMLGNPVRLHRELQSFRKAAQVLSSHRHRLIEEYPNQWIAVHRGKVAAHGSTLNAVLKEMVRNKVPQERTIIHFVEKNQRTMILSGLCSVADLGIPADGLTLKPR